MKRPARIEKFCALLALAAALFSFAGCSKAQTSATSPAPRGAPAPAPKPEVTKIENAARVVHVLVALCDNQNQGIVPVPAHLGDGEDPPKNLYWGAAFGVKTFFSKSPRWTKVAETKNPKENVLERVVFRHQDGDVYLVADAYRGSRMRETVADFFAAVSGAEFENVRAQDATLRVLGGADLVAFVGHNGLMDFRLEKQPSKADDAKREAIILACASRQYFAAPLGKTGARPLLWTTNLMAPEAYILHAALEGWAAGEASEQVRLRAAQAYSKYQKISLKAAQNLLVTGW